MALGFVLGAGIFYFKDSKIAQNEKGNRTLSSAQDSETLPSWISKNAQNSGPLPDWVLENAQFIKGKPAIDIFNASAKEVKDLLVSKNIISADTVITTGLVKWTNQTLWSKSGKANRNPADVGTFIIGVGMFCLVIGGIVEKVFKSGGVATLGVCVGINALGGFVGASMAEDADSATMIQSYKPSGNPEADELLKKMGTGLVEPCEDPSKPC